MPCLEITTPSLGPNLRQTLAEELTKAFEDVTSYSADIFGIRFNEYSPGEASSAGQLWDGKTGRPYVHFLLYCPRLSRSTKQKVVRSFTRVYTEQLRRPDWQPVIHICEHPYDNVGVKGELLSDQYEECANARFYYDVSDD